MSTRMPNTLLTNIAKSKAEFSDDFDQAVDALDDQPKLKVTFRATKSKHRALKLAALKNGLTLEDLLNEGSDLVLAKYEGKALL